MSGERPDPLGLLESANGGPPPEPPEPAAAAQSATPADPPEPNPWAELDELGVICPPL